jgi:tetratricopeptide (TPR) repeat protein
MFVLFILAAATAALPAGIGESTALCARGDFSGALAALEEPLARARAAKDAATIAALTAERARVVYERSSLFQQNAAEAARAIEQADADAKTAKSDAATADVLHLRARAAYSRRLTEGKGSWEDVTALLRQELALREKRKDTRGLSGAWFYLGLCEQMQQRNESAHELFRNALALAEQAGDGFGASYAQRHLGFIHEEKGELDAAQAAYYASVNLRREAGYLAYVPFAQNTLADFVARRRNDPQGAILIYRDAAKTGVQTNNRRAQQASHLALHRLMLALGQPELAAEHLDAAESAARAFGSAELIDEVAKERARRASPEPPPGP